MNNLASRSIAGALLGLALVLTAQPLVAAPAEQSLTGFRVGIQAGHGRGDPGARSCDGAIDEADITAAVGQRVVDLLRGYGAEVDFFVGTDPAMHDYRADAFVSLHTDYCPDPTDPSTPSGYKVARRGGAAGTGLDGSGDASDQLVQALWEEYGRVTGLPEDRSPGRFTPGMLNYYALRQIHGTTPGAIIEMGWLSGDLEFLVNEQDTAAAGVGQAIIRFLTSAMPSPDPDPGPQPAQMLQSATVLLVDVSGSMEQVWRGGVKLDSARNAAADVVHMIQQETDVGGVHHVAVATFASQARLDSGLTTDFAAVRRVIGGLEPQDMTNMGAGLQVANQALASAPAEAQRIIVLLSDGMSNQGLDPHGILAGPVQEAAEAGVCIYTVGFGEPMDLDEDLLISIAAGSTCGAYSYASTPAELGRIYVRLRHEAMGQVIGDFAGQIAQGQTADVGRVTVPADQGELHATLHWPGSELALVVTDPRGRQVNESYPGVSVAEYERLVYLIIQNPVPGDWLLQAVGIHVPEELLDYSSIVSVRERTEPLVTGSSTLWLIPTVATLAVIAAAVVWMQQQRQPGTDVAGVQVLSGSAMRAFSPLRRGQLLIGRDPRCHVALKDPQVSAHHAIVQQTPHGYLLTDLGSTNGTYVNGARVQQVLLQHGDRLRVGQTELFFSGGGMMASSPIVQPSSGRPMARMSVVAGEQESARYRVPSGAVLGRHAACPIDLRADSEISRQHARLDEQDGQWIISDLGSRSGVLVNGHRVDQQVLRPGDEIQIGRTRIRWWGSGQ